MTAFNPYTISPDDLCYNGCALELSEEDGQLWFKCILTDATGDPCEVEGPISDLAKMIVRLEVVECQTVEIKNIWYLASELGVEYIDHIEEQIQKKLNEVNACNAIKIHYLNDGIEITTTEGPAYTLKYLFSKDEFWGIAKR